jgi:GT2 family glycosyltransferase
VSADPAADASTTRGENSTVDALVIAVVLNLNGWPDAVTCLESLQGEDYERLEMIAVDNGSTDDSVAEIRARFPDVELIEAGTNAGFAIGNNLGIRRALARGADFVWLLNNDTVVERSALRAMLAEVDRDPRAGIIGCVLLENHVDEVQTWGGGTLYARFGLATVLTAPADDLAYISGACMLLRREVLETVGLLDEAYFFFMEDVDLSYRAEQAGWSIAIARDGFVRHKGGVTIQRGAPARLLFVDRVYAESCGIFVGKHSGFALIPCAAARIFTIVFRRFRRGAIRHVPEVVAAFVRGVRTGYRARRA